MRWCCVFFFCPCFIWKIMTVCLYMFKHPCISGMSPLNNDESCSWCILGFRLHVFYWVILYISMFWREWLIMFIRVLYCLDFNVDIDILCCEIIWVVLSLTLLWKASRILCYSHLALGICRGSLMMVTFHCGI